MATKHGWLCAALISGFAVGCASGDDDGNLAGSGGAAGTMMTMQPSVPAAGSGVAGMMAAAGGQAPVGMGMPGVSGAGGAVGMMPAAGSGPVVMPVSGAGGAGGDIMVAGMGGMAGGAAGMAGSMMAGMGGSMMAGMGGMAGGTPTTPSCLDGVKEDFGGDGPFKYAAKHSGSVKIWIPEVPAGCKVPIVHVANGTGANCASYQATINRMASHGFIATCYENANTGSGTQGIMAFDTVMKNHPDLFSKALGSTGHSQGGQAAFTVLQRAETKYGAEFKYAGLAMQPASGFGTQPSDLGSWQSVYAKIKSPMFMFSGTADILVSQAWVVSAFNALADTVEAYHWSGAGSTHIPTPQNEAADLAVPWFRWKLLGDNAACKRFFELKTRPGKSGMRWTEVKSQNPQMCM